MRRWGDEEAFELGGEGEWKGRGGEGRGGEGLKDRSSWDEGDCMVGVGRENRGLRFELGGLADESDLEL